MTVENLIHLFIYNCLNNPQVQAAGLGTYVKRQMVDRSDDDRPEKDVFLRQQIQHTSRNAKNLSFQRV